MSECVVNVAMVVSAEVINILDVLYETWEFIPLEEGNWSINELDILFCEFTDIALDGSL